MRAVLCVCLSLFACTPFVGTVEARAANDFPCQTSAIEVTQIPGTTNSFNATGCNQKAIYTCTTSGDPKISAEACVREATAK